MKQLLKEDACFKINAGDGRKARGVVYVAGMLAAVGIFGACATTAWAAPTEGVSISGNIVVRDAAVSGAQVGSLVEGQEVTITGETTGSDGKKWYAITFEGIDGERDGWVRSDLIEAAETTTDGDDDEAADADATDVDTDDAEQPTENAAGTVRMELSSGYVDLADVPDDVAAEVGDRFVESECTLADGTVLGYQLATADALVSNDAILTNFYYLYGTNEIGESGWYVYDASEDSLQKSILDMSYSLTDAEDDAEEQTGQQETGTIVRMLLAVLALVCVLLLILAIVFSVRYRRLRAILEREEREENPEGETRRTSRVGTDEQKKSKTAESARRQERPVKQAPVRQEEETGRGEMPARAQEHMPEETSEKVRERMPEETSGRMRESAPAKAQETGPVDDIIDLDDMDDADYEAMLGQYLDEHMDAEEKPAKTQPSRTQTEEPSKPQPSRAQTEEDFSIPETGLDGYDFPVDDDADYDLQDFLQKDVPEPASDQAKGKKKDEEPSGDDDGEDDLIFL